MEADTHIQVSSGVASVRTIAAHRACPDPYTARLRGIFLVELSPSEVFHRCQKSPGTRKAPGAKIRTSRGTDDICRRFALRSLLGIPVALFGV